MHCTPSNRFSAGSLVQANSDNGVAIFTGYDLRPGEARTARVKIANLGPLVAGIRLVEIDATNDFNDGDLKLTIQEMSDGSSAMVYQGQFGGIPREGVDLGRFEPGEERTYYFTAGLARTGLNPEQARGAGAAYEWETIPSKVAEAER